MGFTWIRAACCAADHKPNSSKACVQGLYEHRDCLNCIILIFFLWYLVGIWFELYSNWSKHGVRIIQLVSGRYPWGITGKQWHWHFANRMLAISVRVLFSKIPCGFLCSAIHSLNTLEKSKEVFTSIVLNTTKQKWCWWHPVWWRKPWFLHLEFELVRRGGKICHKFPMSHVQKNLATGWSCTRKLLILCPRWEAICNKRKSIIWRVGWKQFSTRALMFGWWNQGPLIASSSLDSGLALKFNQHFSSQSSETWC